MSVYVGTMRNPLESMEISGIEVVPVRATLTTPVCACDPEKVSFVRRLIVPPLPRRNVPESELAWIGFGPSSVIVIVVSLQFVGYALSQIS